MTLETTDDDKVKCSACPFCGTELARQQSLAKHLRGGRCS